MPWRLRHVSRIPEGAEKYALAIANLARKLAVMERYERQTLSVRKRAFRKLVAAQRMSKSISGAGQGDQIGLAGST